MKIKLLIFSLVISLCNGVHIPILSDILSATHKVADSIIDGISHGHHSNVDGGVGIKTETYHQSNFKPSNRPEPETIVIIVENGDHSNGYNRPPGNYRPTQHNQRPPFNGNGGYGHGYNDYRPNQNNPVQPDPHRNENFNHNYNTNFRPGGVNNGRPQNYYDNKYQGHNFQRYPNQQYPNYGNNQHIGNNGNYDQNNYIPSQLPPFHGNNQQNNEYPNYNNDIPSQRPPFNGNNQQYIGYPNNNNVKPSQSPPFNSNGNANSDGSNFVKNPTIEQLTERPFSTVKPTATTKMPDNDAPLFIPLSPNENQNTAPKRETDNNKGKPGEGGEEEFELDVRMNE